MTKYVGGGGGGLSILSVNDIHQLNFHLYLNLRVVVRLVWLCYIGDLLNQVGARAVVWY